MERPPRKADFTMVAIMIKWSLLRSCLALRERLRLINPFELKLSDAFSTGSSPHSCECGPIGGSNCSGLYSWLGGVSPHNINIRNTIIRSVRRPPSPLPPTMDRKCPPKLPPVGVASSAAVASLAAVPRHSKQRRNKWHVSARCPWLIPILMPPIIR